MPPPGAGTPSSRPVDGETRGRCGKTALPAPEKRVRIIPTEGRRRCVGWRGFWLWLSCWRRVQGRRRRRRRKLALVIGNADYDGDSRIDVSEAGVARSEAAGYVPDLRNPLNDASDIRDALTRIGFGVDFVTNAAAAAMSTALASFSAKVAAAPDTAQVVVYYAGHAIQIDGANFLIPVKAKLPALDYSTVSQDRARVALERAFLSADRALNTFREPLAPGVNLLILDSCRTNPWAASVAAAGRGPRTGNAISSPAPRGMAALRATIPRTIVVFSTSPGAVAFDGDANNSPFSAALKTWIARPGTVLQILDGVGGEVQVKTGARQTPWFQSASIGEVCLAACDPRIPITRDYSTDSGPFGLWTVGADYCADC